MACIHDKFTNSTGKRNISSQQLWNHLKELYNLPALVCTWKLCVCTYIIYEWKIAFLWVAIDSRKCQQLVKVECVFLIQNEADNLPFPNDENDFNLPDEIFEPPGASEKPGSDYNDEGLWENIQQIWGSNPIRSWYLNPIWSLNSSTGGQCLSWNWQCLTHKYFETYSHYTLVIKLILRCIRFRYLLLS